MTTQVGHLTRRGSTWSTSRPRKKWLLAASRAGYLLLMAVPIWLQFAEERDMRRVNATATSLVSIASALEGRATDTNSYPVVRDLEAIRSFVVPKYTTAVPMADAWGRPLRYTCLTGERQVCQTYVLASAGSDGEFAPATERLLALTTLASATTVVGELQRQQDAVRRNVSKIPCSQLMARDIVYSNGQFLVLSPIADSISVLCRAHSPGLALLMIFAGFVGMIVIELNRYNRATA